MRSLNIAATGMLAQQMNVDVISNNIANLNTTGYKRQTIAFQDLIYQSMRRVGTESSDSGTLLPTGIELGTGVRPAAIYRVTSQGELVATDNPLDLAVQGEGYFSVEMPDGSIAYTRAGAFQLNQNGEVVTADGYLVQPGITIPTGAVSVTVNISGEVITTNSDATTTNVGQFDISTFLNEGGLGALGGNLYLETQASGSATTGVAGDTGFGTILGGFLETSNVDVVGQITSLITAQRAYEMNSQVVSASDEMLQTLAQVA